ncbi:MAG TPA: SGNH/GDSL hydrolase family protein [Candidatus Polarisedimenticolaceae bacterium]|nr:SGNH/GDSL hydrolase family protein [Candidatus Polarisedimenticolaceae bacterium]
MATDRRIAKALATGKTQAREVMARRADALKRRAKAVRAHQRRAGALTARDAAGPGVLVAEGDSWFDYPLLDILRVLDDDYGYDVESVAHKGDPIEAMAYGGTQLDDFARRLEKVHARGEVPRAVLVSGGGNDVAGTEFAMLLDHQASPVPGLNQPVLDGVIDQRIRFAYVTILSRVTAVCRAQFGRPVPILVHGYDYPVPDGRGFLGGWAFLPGPWLQPGFRQKGFGNLDTTKAMTKALIERFDAMIEKIVALPDFAHVTFVDLRGSLPTGSDYKTWWANELHPTHKGFRKIAAKFAATLEALP